MKTGYIYLMTNNANTVIYTGVTNNLQKRIFEHKEKLVEGFTKKYNIVKLVYFEQFDDIKNAIEREKQIKGGSRKKKINLIKSINPEFKDLYNDL
jgi:putative endonuclease